MPSSPNSTTLSLRCERSVALYQQALAVIPGGVNSPVRAFRSVGGSPIFIERGEGPYLFDVDGNQYLDLVGEARDCLSM